MYYDIHNDEIETLIEKNEKLSEKFNKLLDAVKPFDVYLSVTDEMVDSLLMVYREVQKNE